MIAITGATGQLGSLIIKNLAAIVPASSILATTRDTASEKSQALTSSYPGIQVRPGDFDSPSTLAESLAGASKLLIISVNKIGDEAIQAHRRAIDAAKLAGVKKIYYTSHVGAKENSPFSPAHTHWTTEQYLEKSGIPYTSFRNGFYLWSLQYMIKGVEHSNKIFVPKDGKVSWTGHDDLAAAIAKVIASDTEDNVSNPKILNLCNSRAWDMGDIAAILTKVLGKDVQRVVASEDDYVKGLVAHGVPEPMAKMFLGNYTASARGDFSLEDGKLGELLGKEPENAEEWATRTFGQ